MGQMSSILYSPKEYKAIYILINILKKSNTLYSLTGFTVTKLDYDILFTNKWICRFMIIRVLEQYDFPLHGF